MKQIKTPQDLAINGAAPAFEQLLHVGLPNIGNKDDFLKYISDIFDRRWLTNNGPIVQEFEQRVADYHCAKHCVAISAIILLPSLMLAVSLKGESVPPVS